MMKESENDPYSPRVRATGPLLATWVPEELTLKDSHQFAFVGDEADVTKWIKYNLELGACAIKFWFIVTRERSVQQLEKLIVAAGEETKKHNVPLVVHATGIAEAKLSLKANCKVLVHSVEDKKIDDEFIQLATLNRDKVFYCPTLTVSTGYQRIGNRELTTELKNQLERVHPTVKKKVLITPNIPKSTKTPAQQILENAYYQMERDTMAANLKIVYKAGIPIAMGTDAGNPLTLHGPSVFVEMETMETYGMPSLAVLGSATRNAALAIGRSDLGTVEVGKLADLIVVEKDPREGISNLRTISSVIRGGHLFSVEQLQQLLLNTD